MLSLAMIVKNEEKYIDRCLSSVSALVDEMIVVDTGSTDRTKEIAHRHGAKVFDFTWCDDFAAARNYSIEKSSGDWILVLDADEYFIEDYKTLIQGFIQEGKHSGEFEVISRFGKEGQQDQTTRTQQIRMFPRETRYIGRIHEQPEATLPPKLLTVQIYHDGYYGEVNKTGRNIPLLLKAIEDAPDSTYYRYQLGKEYMNLENYQAAENYLLEAYRSLDRRAAYAPTLIVVLLDAFYKNKNYPMAFQIGEENARYLDRVSDYHFGRACFLLDYAIDTQDFKVIPQIEQSYLKCLDIGKNGGREILVGTSSYLAAHNLAVFYQTIGNHEAAKAYYAVAAATQPNGGA